MKIGRFAKLVTIGVFAGIVLAVFLMLIYVFTGNQAYILLFNVDYIPFLKDLHPKYVIGISFHFIFCILSVVLLFYILRIIHLERKILSYVVVYTGGSAVLFFLTILSELPPFFTDYSAWIYWTVGHGVYSLTIGFLVKYLI